ncbi:hypothetical protein AB0K09_31695, partial [Streptomyces sp. NPDC049577]
AARPPAAVGPALLLATAAGALGAAVHEILRARRTEPAPDAPPLSPAASLPYGLFGLGCGVLTTIAALGGVLRHESGAAAAGPAVIALTLSMGAAEWLLYRCRGLALASLRRATTRAGMLLRAARVLALCVTGYLAALTVLTLATELLWPGGPDPTAPAVLALLALGTVLWTGLLLQAYGVAWTPALLCLAAAGAETAALAAPTAAPTTDQLVICTGAAVVLLAVAAALLGRVTTHR